MIIFDLALEDGLPSTFRATRYLTPMNNAGHQAVVKVEISEQERKEPGVRVEAGHGNTHSRTPDESTTRGRILDVGDHARAHVLALVLSAELVMQVATLCPTQWRLKKILARYWIAFCRGLFSICALSETASREACAYKYQTRRKALAGTS